jgi:hypothetical protein
MFLAIVILAFSLDIVIPPPYLFAHIHAQIRSFLAIFDSFFIETDLFPFPVFLFLSYISLGLFIPDAKPTVEGREQPAKSIVFTPIKKASMEGRRIRAKNKSQRCSHLKPLLR